VPPPQSEAIVEAVKQRDGDIEYIVFEGEGHGFRKAESLKKGITPLVAEIIMKPHIVEEEVDVYDYLCCSTSKLDI
jgi:hypothetical protein